MCEPLNTRQLAARFLALPFRYQIEAAKAAGVFEPSDLNMKDENLYNELFKRAAATGALERLRLEVERLRHINRKARWARG